jgi:lysophospholipase L1-like esterase
MKESGCRLGAVGLSILCSISWVRSEEGSRQVTSNKWEADIQRFEEADKKQFPPTNAVLFVGSSSFTLWHTLAKDMQPLTVIPRGFGGSTAADALYFADRIIAPYRPRLLVLYVGHNDVVGRFPPAILQDCRDLVDRLHGRLPQTRVLFVAVRPSRAREALSIEINTFNRMLLEYAEQDDRLGFVDANPPLLDENGLARTNLLSVDLLHLNTDGYKAWGPRIKAAILEWERTERAVRPGPLQRLRLSAFFDQPVYAGKSVTVELPLANTGERPIIFDAQWRVAPRGGIEVSPPEIRNLRLTAGAGRRLAFAIRMPPDAIAPPVLEWSATDGRDTVRHASALLALPSGRYAGPGHDPLRLSLARADQVKTFSTPWDGPGDCSATAWLKREADGLHARLDVTDDVLFGDNANPWDNDAVELYFDLRPEARRLKMSRSPGCFQVIAVPAIGAKFADTLHFYSEPGNSKIEGATIKSGRRAGGYWVEVFLPFDGIRRAGHGEAGESFSFDAAVDDADAPGSIRQQMRWAGARADHMIPGYWGLMEPASAP